MAARNPGVKNPSRPQELARSLFPRGFLLSRRARKSKEGLVQMVCSGLFYIVTFHTQNSSHCLREVGRVTKLHVTVQNMALYLTALAQLNVCYVSSRPLHQFPIDVEEI